MTAASPQDRKIFAVLADTFGRQDTAAGIIVDLGRFFLGAPYAAETLEHAGPESLVINLRRFDCFTFVENMVALARLFSSGSASFKHYRAVLMYIRYRRGFPEGYASRLHYFTDWLFENRRKGVLKDMTADLGGEPCGKSIHFMTDHAERYPALADHTVYRQIREVERRMQRRLRHYIPKAALMRSETRIADGDVIAVTTRVKGLDVTHAGIAIRLERRLHLLHASSHAGRVLISEDPLVRYLSRDRRCSGIMVARIVDPERAGSGT